MGTGAGGQNTTGQSNTMFGNTSGAANTTGSYNAFFGGSSGVANTTGSANIFFGPNAGYNNTSGSNNLYVGVNAGVNADPAANQNLYVGSPGAAGESGAIRIGDPAKQSAAYMVGISGANTTGGMPVFVDSTGKLGTGGGVNFTIAGTGTAGAFDAAQYQSGGGTVLYTGDPSLRSVFVGLGAGASPALATRTAL